MLIVATLLQLLLKNNHMKYTIIWAEQIVLPQLTRYSDIAQKTKETRIYYYVCHCDIISTYYVPWFPNPALQSPHLFSSFRA